MASNKKPRKARTVRHVAIPKLIPLECVNDVYPYKAVEVYAAITSMIERPTKEHCNNLSKLLSEIAGGLYYARGQRPLNANRDDKAIAINSAIMTIERIVDRHEAGGPLVVTEGEKRSLQAAAGKLDDALSAIPINCFNRAVIEITTRVAVNELLLAG